MSVWVEIIDRIESALDRDLKVPVTRYPLFRSWIAVCEPRNPDIPVRSTLGGVIEVGLGDKDIPDWLSVWYHSVKTGENQLGMGVF